MRKTGTYIAAVINKPGEVSTFCGIDDCVVVNSEHVTAPDAFILVSLFTHVSNDLQKTPHLLSERAAASCEQRSTQGSEIYPVLVPLPRYTVPNTPTEKTSLKPQKFRMGFWRACFLRVQALNFSVVEDPTPAPPSHMPASLPSSHS